MDQDRVMPRNVTMYPKDWEIVDMVDRQFNFRSTSMALRHIVNQYQKMQEQIRRLDMALSEAA